MSTRFRGTSTDGASIAGLPVAGAITSTFGARDIEAHASGHSGVDIAADLGALVQAPADGVVRDVFSLAIAGAPWAQAWKQVFGNSASCSTATTSRCMRPSSNHQTPTRASASWQAT